VEIPLAYLTERTSVECALADNTFDGKPFGNASDDWERLLAKRIEGDELWNFAPPNRNVLQLWGIALVRSGKVVSTVITAVD
jgi:hypothetical protein